MRKFAVLLVFLTLAVCSCKTKYIETVHYQPVEVHDTISSVLHVRDSITLHDSVFIHMKGDTVFSEKWRTEYRWRTHTDTVCKIREVPVVMTDTISHIKEVPVEKVVYKQRWWQKVLTGFGGISAGALALLCTIMYVRRRTL